MSNLLVDISRGSALRFIKLVLSLNETQYWYHQTLTFGKRIEDFNEAKKYLNTFSDSLEKEMKKEFQMGAIYIMGRQEKGGVHFHIVFFFYGNQSLTVEKLGERLRRAAWKRWEKLSKGALQKWNRLTIRPKKGALEYLLRFHFKIVKMKREKGRPLWNGIRNDALITANSTPVSHDEVLKTFKLFYAKHKLSVPVKEKPAAKVYTMRDVLKLKEYVEADQCRDWEMFKRQRTGRKAKVSNADLRDFFNGKLSTAKPQRKIKSSDDESLDLI